MIGFCLFHHKSKRIVIWKVKAYDKNVHLYQYDWELIFTHKENGAEEKKLLETYRVGDVFVLIEDVLPY